MISNAILRKYIPWLCYLYTRKQCIIYAKLYYQTICFFNHCFLYWNIILHIILLLCQLSYVYRTMNYVYKYSNGVYYEIFRHRNMKIMHNIVMKTYAIPNIIRFSWRVCFNQIMRKNIALVVNWTTRSHILRRNG